MEQVSIFTGAGGKGKKRSCTRYHCRFPLMPCPALARLGDKGCRSLTSVCVRLVPLCPYPFVTRSEDFGTAYLVDVWGVACASCALWEAWFRPKAALVFWLRMVS